MSEISPVSISQYRSRLLVTDYSTNPGVCIIDDGEGNWLVGYKVSLSGNVFIPADLEIQVQRASTYAETHIKNQPLSTLDQNGENWLKGEYLRSVNLYSTVVIPGYINDVSANVTMSITSGEVSKLKFTGINNAGSDPYYYHYLNGFEIGKRYSITVTPSRTLDYVQMEMSGMSNVVVSSAPYRLIFTATATSSRLGYEFVPNGGDVTSCIMINEGVISEPYVPSSDGPVAHVTDVEGVLLWKNGNEDTSFGEQTITVSDMSSYKYLMFGIKINSSSTSITQYFKIKCKNSSGGYAWFSFIDDTSTDTYKRTIKINSMTSITFNQGYRNNSATDNSCIPTTIYGIK